MVAGRRRARAPPPPRTPLQAHACVNCPPINMTASGRRAHPPPGRRSEAGHAGHRPRRAADRAHPVRGLHHHRPQGQPRARTSSPARCSPWSAPRRRSSTATHSTVSLLTDAQAQLLEPLRAGLEAALRPPRLAGTAPEEGGAGLGLHHPEHHDRPHPAQRHSHLAAAQRHPWRPAVGAGDPAPRPACPTDRRRATGTSGRSSTSSSSPGRAGTLNPAAPATPKMPFVMSVPAAPAAAERLPRHHLRPRPHPGPDRRASGCPRRWPAPAR